MIVEVEASRSPGRENTPVVSVRSGIPDIRRIPSPSRTRKSDTGSAASSVSSHPTSVPVVVTERIVGIGAYTSTESGSMVVLPYWSIARTLIIRVPSVSYGQRMRLDSVIVTHEDTPLKSSS